MRWSKPQAGNGPQQWTEWACRGSAISIPWDYQEMPAQGCRWTRLPAAMSTELQAIPSPSHGSGMLCTAPDLRAPDQVRLAHRRRQQRGAGGAAAAAGTSSDVGSAWSTEKKEVPVGLQPPSPHLWMGARWKAKPSQALAQDTYHPKCVSPFQGPAGFPHTSPILVSPSTTLTWRRGRCPGGKPCR